MKIATFVGSNQDIDVAIDAAGDRAATLLESLSPSELYSVESQTLVETGEYQSLYSHIITVVYE